MNKQSHTKSVTSVEAEVEPGWGRVEPGGERVGRG